MCVCVCVGVCVCVCIHNFSHLFGTVVFISSLHLHSDLKYGPSYKTKLCYKEFHNGMFIIIKTTQNKLASLSYKLQCRFFITD